MPSCVILGSLFIISAGSTVCKSELKKQTKKKTFPENNKWQYIYIHLSINVRKRQNNNDSEEKAC